MTNWMYSLGLSADVSGCYGDELEVTWLRECWRTACDELENVRMEVTEDPIGWKRLDFSLLKAVQGMINRVVERCLKMSR